MTGNASAEPRRTLAVGGSDRRAFLQNLVTSDVPEAPGRLAWTALLTPQGKYLTEFFLLARDVDILLDAPADAADALAGRLGMYRLRADVSISEAGLHAHRGLGPVPDDGFADPRHPGLGWRAYRETPQPESGIDWNEAHVEAGVPVHGADLVVDGSYILEMGFEAAGGVDFRKGCYVGQEVTARMKHKTELRKGLARIGLGGPVPTGTEIAAGGKPVGRVGTVSGNRALAHLRFDRAGAGGLTADGREVTLLDRLV